MTKRNINSIRIVICVAISLFMGFGVYWTFCKSTGTSLIPQDRAPKEVLASNEPVPPGFIEALSFGNGVDSAIALSSSKDDFMRISSKTELKFVGGSAPSNVLKFLSAPSNVLKFLSIVNDVWFCYEEPIKVDIPKMFILSGCAIGADGRLICTLSFNYIPLIGIGVAATLIAAGMFFISLLILREIRLPERLIGASQPVTSNG